MTQTLPERIADGTLLPFGQETFTFGQDVFELTDSSPLVRENDFDALRERMSDDGYLFIRGFHPRNLADAAYLSVLQAIQERGGLDPDADWREGIASSENKSFSFFREVAVAHAPPVLATVNGAHTFDFYEKFLEGPAHTFDKKWLRAMAKGGSNFFHYDSAYVGRGTLDRFTMWSAFSDIDLQNGPLIICLGSHKDKKLIETYGQIDMDRDLIDPVFSADPREMVEKFGFPLATARFQPGDVILFGMHLLHSSIPNQTNRYRISIDARYQREDAARDERFYGADGNWLGNFYNKGVSYTPMAEMRQKWGLD